MGTVVYIAFLVYVIYFRITYSIPLYPNVVQPGVYNVQLRCVCMCVYCVLSVCGVKQCYPCG